MNIIRTSAAVGRSDGFNMSSERTKSLASVDTVSHSGLGKSYFPLRTDMKMSRSVLP